MDGEIGVDAIDAVAQQEREIGRQIRVLEAAHDPAGHACLGIVELRSSLDDLGEGLGIADALGGEQLLVPVDDEVVEVERQRVEPAVFLGRVIPRALGVVGKIEVGIG